MPQIIPIRDLAKTAQIAAMCKESGEPIYVTKNGYAELVVINANVYEAQLAKWNMIQAVNEGLKDVDEGRYEDGETVMRELKEKYGL